MGVIKGQLTCHRFDGLGLSRLRTQRWQVWLLMLFIWLVYLQGVPAMATEEPNYEVILSVDDVELRHYAPYLTATVTVQGSHQQASSAGFSKLAKFIFGDNTNTNTTATDAATMEAIKGVQAPSIEPVIESIIEPMTHSNSASQSAKISMTAPVLTQATEVNETEIDEIVAADAPKGEQTQQTWQVTFVMPRQYSMATLPKPNDPTIRLTQMPATYYAVIKFSGLAGADKVATKTAQLQRWMQTQPLTVTGAPSLARYDPPWTLPFMRRNEVWIPYEPTVNSAATSTTGTQD